MTTLRKPVAWTGLGLTLALFAGSPAIAEDVELLVSTQNAGSANTPNILFILDSSGSMTTVENTQEPFDSSEVYPGSCQSNKYYWTESNSVPSCATSNTKVIDKDKFVCEQGITQMATAGTFSDTMTQYRRTRRGEKWRRLRSGRNNMVECEADSGQHGDGVAGEVYAQIGSNLPAFTSDPAREVAWGSSPTDRTVNIYDPNYLNWYHNSPVTSMSRTDIVKAVTKNVLGSINNVNVGFMHFNWDQGGLVNRAVKDLDSSRAAAIAEVDALPASGWTPLSETMYEAALYWHGKGAKYGGLTATDPDALYSNSPMVYDNPAKYACAKNFTVLLTDGEPTQDVDVYDKVKDLPNYTTTMGSSSCSGGNVNGACLDDIAEYLSKEDINSSVPGDQTVTTYTIGFTVDLPLLKATAENSGGEYYLADDVQTLTDALTDIVNNIFDRDISFTAPAVSVNTFNRTQHLNDMYISVFRAANTSHWPGNVKKYTIADGVIADANGADAVDPITGYFSDNSQSFWTPAGTVDGADVNQGGAVSQLPDPANRNVYTNIAGSDLSAPGNHISTSNIGAFSLNDFGLTGSAEEPTVADLINWIRGEDVNDFDNDPDTTVRQQMGDTLHSQPASIVYGGDPANPASMDIVVYVATNDGHLHAIDATSGQELWSFMPKEFLPGVQDLFDNDVVNFKQYGIDGDIVPIVAVDPITGYFSDNSQSFWTPAGTVDGADVNQGGAVSQLPDQKYY